MTLDKLLDRCRLVLDDNTLPVMAAHSGANRGNSFAQGLSGIRLAIAEMSGEALELQSTSKAESVFESEISWNPTSGSLRFSSSYEKDSERILGDVFTGECARIWSDIVLGQVPRIDIPNRLPGSVLRPGIGHGELIRDFAIWLSNLCEGDFLSPEEVFPLGGWCYGQAGLASILSLVNHFGALASSQTEQLRAMPEVLIDCVKNEKSTAESGLCHGTAGMLVVAIGVARLLDDHSLIEKVQSVFRECVDNEAIIKFHPELEVDCSWLTGSSGIAWASAVMEKSPIVNPLFPLDTKLRG